MSLDFNPGTDSSYPRLPCDIQLLIVDEAASDPAMRSVVKALALTHHALREHCQKHIFSAVNYSQHTSVLEILKDSPQLASYIHTLIIPSYLLLSESTRIAKAVEFLSKLHCLHELQVLQGHPWLLGLCWLHIPQKIATELLRLIRSPVLWSFQIHDVNHFPFQDFLRLGLSPNLTSLKIKSLHFANSKALTDSINEGHDEGQMGNLGTPQASAPERDRILQGSEGASKNSFHNPPKLQELFLGMESRDVLKIILGTTLDLPSHGRPLFDLSYLRRLAVVWWGAKDSQVERLLIKSCSAVEDLEVILGYEIRSFSGLSSAILQGSGQVLKKLTLLQRRKLYPWEVLLRKPLFGVLKEMQVLSDSMNTLNTIVIKLSVDVETHDESMRAFWEVSKQCQELDKLLVDLKNFPALRKVRFSIVFDIADPPGSPVSPDSDEEVPRISHKKFTKKAGAHTQELFPRLNAASPAIDVKVDAMDNCPKTATKD